MAKFCPNFSTADSGHLQIVNIMVQPDFWLFWSIASDKLSHMTRKPTRCWKLALVVRLNILRFVIDLKRKCWHFPAFENRSQILKGFHLRVFFIHAVHLSRPFKHMKNHIPTRVTMPSCCYLPGFLSFSPKLTATGGFVQHVFTARRLLVAQPGKTLEAVWGWWL